MMNRKVIYYMPVVLFPAFNNAHFTDKAPEMLSDLPKATQIAYSRAGIPTLLCLSCFHTSHSLPGAGAWLQRVQPEWCVKFFQQIPGRQACYLRMGVPGIIQACLSPIMVRWDASALAQSEHTGEACHCLSFLQCLVSC